MAMTILEPDIFTSVQNAVVKRIIHSGIFESSEIQRANTSAPDVLPYCRVTLAMAGDWDGDSQYRLSKTVIAEVDIFTKGLSNTQQSRGLASAIEKEFGRNSRVSTDRNLVLNGWKNVDAVIETFSRGTESAETDTGLYRTPVLLYVKVTVNGEAEYNA